MGERNYWRWIAVSRFFRCDVCGLILANQREIGDEFVVRLERANVHATSSSLQSTPGFAWPRLRRGGDVVHGLRPCLIRVGGQEGVMSGMAFSHASSKFMDRKID